MTRSYPRAIVSLRPLVLAAVLAGLALPVIAEDLTVVSTVTANGKTGTATQYISDGRLLSSDGEVDTILDYESGKMVVIDHKKKTWAETSMAEMRAQLAELDELIEDNPMIGKMLGGTLGKVEVVAHPDGREIAGYATERYTLSMGPKLTMDLWAAPDLEVPISYYDARKMVYTVMGPIGVRFNQLFDEMKKIDGLPLATRLNFGIIGRDMETEQTATEVRKGPVPANVFDPPAGYKKKKRAFK